MGWNAIRFAGLGLAALALVASSNKSEDGAPSTTEQRTAAAPPPVPDDGLQLARDEYSATQRELLEREGPGFTVWTVATDYVVKVPGGACTRALIAKVEQISRPHLANVGFRRVVCSPEGHAIPVQ